MRQVTIVDGRVVFLEAPRSWQRIDTAPTKGPVVEVEVWNGREIRRAHYAHSDGDGYQPSFGPAWFYGVGDPISWYNEVSPPPTLWRPLALEASR